jgi:hypothetical protein
LLKQTITTEAQQKWLVKLMGYDFTIKYKKGHENSAANNLLKIEDHGQLTTISNPIPNWVEPIKDEVLQEKELQDMVRVIHREKE